MSPDGGRRDPETVLVALGASLGDRLAQLDSAAQALVDSPGITVGGGSAVYDTAPVGGVAAQRFLNAAVTLHTSLEPHALLDRLQAIERALGRVRNRRWEDRPIDLDIVLWGHRLIATDRLVVPHPALAERRFVLAPLGDLMPHAEHPAGGQRFGALLRALPTSPADDGFRRLDASELRGAWSGWQRDEGPRQAL